MPQSWAEKQLPGRPVPQASEASAWCFPPALSVAAVLKTLQALRFAAFLAAPAGMLHLFFQHPESLLVFNRAEERGKAQTGSRIRLPA